VRRSGRIALSQNPGLWPACGPLLPRIRFLAKYQVRRERGCFATPTRVAHGTEAIFKKLEAVHGFYTLTWALDRMDRKPFSKNWKRSTVFYALTWALDRMDRMARFWQYTHTMFVSKQ
jgi:hypothetical protein